MVILHHIQQKYLLILHFYCDLLSENLKMQTLVRDKWYSLDNKKNQIKLKQYFISLLLGS